METSDSDDVSLLQAVDVSLSQPLLASTPRGPTEENEDDTDVEHEVRTEALCSVKHFELCSAQSLLINKVTTPALISDQLHVL